MKELRWNAAGALLFIAVLSAGGVRLHAELGPPAVGAPAPDLGTDAQVSAERIRQSVDPARDATALAQGDPVLAAVLALDLDSLPAVARPAVAMAAMDPDLRDALIAEAGVPADSLARAFWGPDPQSPRPLDALGALLDYTDEALASGAAQVACTLPRSRAARVGGLERTGLRGQGLALMVSGCGRSSEESLAALLPLLDRDEPLAPVAALELARLGDPSALGALQEAAQADPEGSLGLAAAYGVAVLSSTSASATQSVPRR